MFTPTADDKGYSLADILGALPAELHNFDLFLVIDARPELTAIPASRSIYE